MERPKLKENPDFSRIVKHVENMLTEARPKDYHAYLFEEVMETLYGDRRKFWEWFNKQKRFQC